jgi:hypothetical protein
MYKTEMVLKQEADSGEVPMHFFHIQDLGSKKKLHGLSPRANYTDRATAACQRSDCQLLQIESATWSV